MRARNLSEQTIRETYRRHYRRTRNWAEAWNDTWDELAGRDQNLRRVVADVLQWSVDEILYEEGDPLQVVIQDAAKMLEEDEALETLDKEFAQVVKGLTEEEIEEIDTPILYLEFDPETGELQSWVISHEQYYRGHAGPTVTILPGESMKDVKREIGNTLAAAMPDVMFEPEPTYDPEDIATINRHRASLGMKPIDPKAGWTPGELADMAEAIRKTGRMQNPVDRLKRRLTEL